MQLTPNYNLKKPEGTDPVDIQDINDNADLIDAALKKKAESSGGDISGMTVKTLDDITTEFPVPEAGESTKTFLGKVKKFFSDTKNWMTGVCLIGQIVNNCVTNNAKLPLSAAQGKALMDLYTVLNTNLGKRIANGNPFTGLDSLYADGQKTRLYISNKGIASLYTSTVDTDSDWRKTGDVILTSDLNKNSAFRMATGSVLAGSDYHQIRLQVETSPQGTRVLAVYDNNTNALIGYMYFAK